MKCPVCRQDVAPDAPDLPFCGPRCKLIDLGRWATEEYVIPGAPADLASDGKDPDED